MFTDLDNAAAARIGVDELFPAVYADLRRMAARRLDRQDHPTLQPTALVHELFVRLRRQPDTRFVDRAHFFAVAAHAMRAILADRARARGADKRGAAWTVSLAGIDPAGTAPAVDISALDAALEKLEALDARQARIVELRFFGGLTIPETAQVVGISEMTVKREWRVAKAWLRRELDAS